MGNSRARYRCAAAAALLFATASFASGAQSAARPASGGKAPAAPAAAELRTVRAVRQLRDPAATGKPIHVQAIVTYYDSVAPNLFVQDRTAGIWVDLRGLKTPPPQPGQVLDLRGTVGVGFSPYIAQPRLAVIGHSKPPAPIRLAYEQAITGAYDSQWAEMDGVVRSFLLQAEGSVLVMDVATPTASFKVRVPNFHAPFPSYLVDAKVRFRGVMGAAFNRQNQIVSVHLMMPSLAYLDVLAPAPSDPFSLPRSAINSIRRFSSDLPDVHRVMVQGIVTAQFPGRGLFLMDSSGGVYVESGDSTVTHPGDEVQVAGFPAVGAYSPVLRSGDIRPTGKHLQQTPAQVTGAAAMRGGYDAQLVRVRGIVLAHFRLGRDEVLGLRTPDGVVYQATLRSSAPSNQLAVEVGSTVELTGICSVKADENGNPAAFEIVLRTPEDVHLLSAPPWFTVRRVLALAGGLVLVTLAIAAWVAVLRRQVRRQTMTMQKDMEARIALENRYRRTFERNLTGLFIAEPDGTLLDCNEACAQILGFPNRAAMLQQRDQVRKTIAELATGVFVQDSLVNSEHRFQRRDGAWAWVLSNVRMVDTNDKTVIEGGLVDISERKLADERIKFLAYYDALTGLPNRALLMDRLQQGLAAARRRRESLAVLFLDVDWFKNINDSLGHPVGDRLLKKIAERLQACARELDTVARLGGDEFVVALNGISCEQDAVEVAERVLRQVETGFWIDERLLNITCSIGIAVFPEHGTDVDTLIKNADAAMYTSKDSGRNRCSVFHPDMGDLALEQLTLETNLRTAIDRNELSLVFQPEVNLLTGDVICCEALLRWNNAELGQVSPARFIPVAERTGMIISIGEWVLRQACRQCVERAIPRVAVNVSQVQLRQPGFCQLVRKVLEEVGLPPERLELELTESLLVRADGDARRILEQLRDMGVSLALDDFGTGYSSLGYLRQLPVDKLKIDRSFVRDLPSRSEDSTIVGAVVSMAGSLGLEITAEGVETAEQLAVLRDLGCEQAQGYYICIPLPGELLMDRIRAGFLAPAALTRVADV